MICGIDCGDARERLGPLHVQRVHLLQVDAVVALGELGDRDAQLARLAHHVVVDVRDVLDVVHVVGLELEVAADRVEGHERQRVAEVAHVVGGDAADVHPHDAGLDRLERILAARHRVEDLEQRRPSPTLAGASAHRSTRAPRALGCSHRPARSPTLRAMPKTPQLKIARVRVDGRTSTALVKGRRVHLVRGGPLGKLEETGDAYALSAVTLLAPIQPPQDRGHRPQLLHAHRRPGDPEEARAVPEGRHLDHRAVRRPSCFPRTPAASTRRARSSPSSAAARATSPRSRSTTTSSAIPPATTSPRASGRAATCSGGARSPRTRSARWDRGSRPASTRSTWTSRCASTAPRCRRPARRSSSTRSARASPSSHAR